ncbi:MAG: HupE/UreJ family protein [Acidobacteria bacterium]|nr:HupE/UreJ family protein [Acidobacteriota bacterium]
MRTLWAICLAAGAWGHDAPAQVTVHLHMRPVDGAMRVLARIPMEAVRDVDFPVIEGGYLDVAATAPRLTGLAKLWAANPLTLFEDGVQTGAPRILATQISKESDRSFVTYEQADAHIREGWPANSERLFWKQVFFDVAMEYPVRDARAKFSVRPGYADLGERVNVVLHFEEKTFLVDGDVDAFPLEPSWWQASRRFVRMGFVHILEGADHLLFLLCLVIPFRKVRPLVWVVTAFTVAHSITLIASAMDMAPGALWFPPLVELLIAVSIVFVALGNILGWTGHRSWMLAFGFGLAHGFGFSFALRESMQFAGTHLAAALLSFNVGVELGQLAALAVMVPLVNVFLQTVSEERTGMIVLSAVAAHVGWQWMWERGAVLGKYTFAAPIMSAAAGATALKWILGGMILWAAIWASRRVKE